MANQRGRPKIYHREELNNLTAIPEDLKAIPHWVVWRSQHRENQKDAKIPITPGLGLTEAKVNDPQSWRPFNEARAWFQKEESLLGVGFVFHGSDPFTGIDIDDCRDPITEELSDSAKVILKEMDSYAEVSPSGTGIKIFIKGKAPGKKQRRGGIEIYSEAHYFTVTGRRLPGIPETINERQGQLADLYLQVFGSTTDPPLSPAPTNDPLLARVRSVPDETLLQKAFSSDARFKQLYEGDASAFSSRSEADFALCCKLAYWTRADAPRMDSLFCASALYRPKWDRVSAITVEKACSRELRRWDPASATTTERTIKNDLFNAELFNSMFEGQFVYVKEWNEWLHWENTHWERNMKDMLLVKATKSLSQELRRRAFDAPLDQQAKEVAWAVKVGNVSAANSIETLARAYMPASACELDNGTFFFACTNGTIDLTNGSLRPAKPSDLSTRCTNLQYDSEALCPLFDKFLSEIMCGNEEMICYLWRVLGYCLTGEVREHVFFILHGDGLNGKSTFVDILKAVLSGYAQSARFQSFLSRGTMAQTSANDDIAHLAGARAVVALEADEAAKLDSSLVKNLTGGDAIRARFLYSGEFEFKPRLKLFLVSNYVPRIDDTSHAIWRRVHYIPFKYRVPEDKIDQSLPLKLYGELEGILAKAVQGCLEWQKGGLQPPRVVAEATSVLRHEFDIIGAALEDVTVPDPQHGRVLHAHLLHAISKWFEENNYRNAPRTHQLIKDLRRRGFEDKRQGGNKLYWYGLSLRAPVQVEVEL